MQFRVQFDDERNLIVVRIGGERWQRKGHLSVAQLERLARSIVLSKGAAHVFSDWGFERCQNAARRAA